jgi:uncharacterized protein (TIGR02145 family)
MYNIELKNTTDANTSPAFWNGAGAYPIPVGFTIKSFTDATGAPGMIKCIPMTGNINFSIPPIVSKSQPASFALTAMPTMPAASAITYTWSAPNFVPDTYTGTPFNTTVPVTANTYPVTLTARSEGYCDKSVTNNVTVIDCVPPATFTLLASATGFCEDDVVGVTFSLQGTENGRKYQLYRDSDPVGSILNGTGSAETFTGGPFITPGVYTAQSEVEGQYCGVAMNGTHPVSKNLKPVAPAISQPVDVCYNSGDLVFTILSYSGTPTWTDNGNGTVDGLSITFASGVATGAKTVKAQSSQTYIGTPTCYSAEVSASATVNAVPANPTIAASSRCGAGTVTLSAASSGAVIDWYADAIGGTSLFTGASYTPEITASTTYYAQARFESTGCVSAARIPMFASADDCCHAPGATGITFSAFNPCPCTTGSTWTLTDARDGKTYKVKYLEDGRFWMVQNLGFGNLCSKTSFTGSTTTQTGKINNSGTYYGDCRAGYNSAAGPLYDWAAAMQHPQAYYGVTSSMSCSGTASGTSTGRPAACQGLCPQGWHLPTLAELSRRNCLIYPDQEYCSTSSSNSYWGPNSTFEGTYNMLYACDGKTASENLSGNRVWYWTSTPLNTVKAYSIYIRSQGAVYIGNTGSAQLDKCYGASIRCIMNY